MNIQLTSTISVSDDVLSRTVDTEELILSLDLGEYFGLNEVGGLIWKLLQQPVHVSEIASAIISEFNVTQDQAEADLLDFLKVLADKQLIRLR